MANNDTTKTTLDAPKSGDTKTATLGDNTAVGGKGETRDEGAAGVAGVVATGDKVVTGRLRRYDIPTDPELDAPPPAFSTPQEERAWYKDREARIAKRERAWQEYPPGTVLTVATARGIPQRRRAGLEFSKTPVKVAVINDLNDPTDVAEAQGSGALVTDPAGAAAIFEDARPETGGALIVMKGDQASMDLEAQNADLRAQLEAMTAERDRWKAQALGTKRAPGLTDPDTGRKQNATRG